MGKKYIIELEDNESVYKTITKNDPMFQVFELLSLTPYIEPDTEAAYAHGYSNAELKYRAEVKEAYQKGLSDAWDAAKKIANMPYNEEEKAFGSGGWAFIEKHTASEAIEKIRQHEQEKKEKEEQIQVGDEVEDGVANLIVLEINQDGTVSGFDDAGSIIHATPRKKTGRHFPEIAEVLQKMRE